MDAVIHIGFPKTGTTTIQSFLFKNRRALQRHGIDYARYNRIVPPQVEYSTVVFDRLGRLHGQRYVRNWLRIPTLEHQARYVRRFEMWLEKRLRHSTARLFVVSCEFLAMTMTNKRRIHTLDAWLRQRFERVSYLAYVRRQEECFLSWYSEGLKLGNTKSLGEARIDRRLLDYSRALEPWMAAIGKERFTLRLFEKSALKDENLLSDFCDATGLPAAHLYFPPARNTRLSATAARRFLKLNWFLRKFGPGEPMKKYILLGATILLERLGRNARPLQIDQTMTDEIRAHYSDSNELLRKRHFPDRDELFPAREQHMPNCAQYNQRT